MSARRLAARRIAAAAAAALAAASLAACRAALELAPSDADRVLSHQVLRAPDPGLPGPHAVRRLYYGSGTDRRRPEFRDSVSIRTPTVDASKLVDLGRDAKSRNAYWGFTPRSFPLNGRVWYPEGPGPFPVVLVVHGNHDMKDFSDPGYGYLGELLASRGFITVSVDENFVNGRIRGENDARAWLLLKHLEAWREFDRTEGGPFHGKVDLGRVALIGHSRGGEAVGHAAAFNRLRHYPDDASLRWDFGFGIRGVIAIAPVDGQYRPADRLEPDVRDVSYLVFHGSHDGDVSSFMGLRQYQRVSFTHPETRAAADAGAGAPPGDGAADAAPRFKSAVYVYRANHGQWNTVWGNRDNGPRSGRILDLRGLLDPEEQLRFGRLYIAAFLEATLHDDRRYLPLFRDHRVAGGWLPRTMYITRFQEESFRPVATFDEDIDVTTGTVRGVTLAGDSLATWKEGGLNLRTANSPAEGSSLDAYAVTLGWNRRLAEDTARLGAPASYTVTLPDTLARAWGLGPASSLAFLLGPTPDEPAPRRPPRDSTARDSARDAGRDAARPARGKRDDDAPKPPMDLTVEVADAAGETARLPLAAYGPVRRPLEMRILRRGDIERRQYPRLWELVLQSYDLPLRDFLSVNPRLDPARLRTVRFVFDRTPAGTVVLDDIGFARMDPAFTSAVVPVVANR